MYEFEWDIRSQTFMWGTSGDGIGIFYDEEGNLNWGINIVIHGDIYFIDGARDIKETEIIAIKEYERLKKELE
jgi:hypothetical protein